MCECCWENLSRRKHNGRRAWWKQNRVSSRVGLNYRVLSKLIYMPWLLVVSTSLRLLPILVSMGCHYFLSFAELLLQIFSQESLKDLLSFTFSKLFIGSNNIQSFIENVKNWQIMRLPFTSKSLKNYLA